LVTVTLAPTDTTPTFTTLIPPPEPPSPTPPLPNPLTLAIALHTDGSAVSASGFLLPFASTTFAVNPVDSSRVAVVDTRGLLYLFTGGVAASQGVRVRVSPFLDFEPQSAEENQVRVAQIGWSPDGTQLAFLVVAERDDRDGVWILDNPQANSLGSAHQVFRECPPPIQLACTVVIGGEPSLYNSLHFDWNPGGSALLVSLDLTGEGRRAFTVIPRANDPTHLQPIYRYGSASWSWDGTRILVSGAGPDGRVVLAWLDPASGAQTPILDGTARGLWLQDAVERPDGSIVALGSIGGSASAMSLYDGSGALLSAPIGTQAPQRVVWSPDRDAVLVMVNDGAAYHYYVAQVDGQVREITEGFAGALSVEWVGGVSAIAQAATPSGGSLVQSRFGLHVNAAVQVVAPVGVNLRAAPSTQAQVLAAVQTFDYVVIVGGPVVGEGLIWWQVKTGGGLVGWAAEGVRDVQLLSLSSR
jgi:hypothetical protein